MNQPDGNNNFSIVDKAIHLNQQFKDETGIDLIQKSPQALGLLCVAETLSDISDSLNKVADNIGYAPDPGTAIAEIGDSIYRGLNAITKAVHEDKGVNDGKL